MKRLLMICLILLTLTGLAFAEATPIPGYTLKESASEVKVYAERNANSKIVGYIIVGGRQACDVLEVHGDWCYVRFTSIRGDTYGYIPLSRFNVEHPATPTPAPTEMPTNQATVANVKSGYRLNLRSQPYESASSLAKYYTGVDVALTGQRHNGFVSVSVHGLTGWMDQRYLISSGSVLIETPVVTVRNKGSGANLRTGPATSYSRLGWYAHGTTAYVLGVTKDNWYHVEMPDGKVGFMSSGLLSEEYPFSYGSDSDGPNSSDLGVSETTMYITTRVTGNQVNLRKAADASSGIVGSFYSGTPVTVSSYTRTGWAYVRIGETVGYVDASCLTADVPLNFGRRVRVDNPYGTGLNLRRMPTSGSELLTFITDGVSVTLLGTLPNGWCYVNYGGLYGYVLRDGLKY